LLYKTSKRILDIIFSLLGLFICSPFLLAGIILIWLQDLHNPFYVAKRIGRNGTVFGMLKLRTMIVDADKTGVDSTTEEDSRLTPMGRIIRKMKIDELPQFCNVLLGQMSLVGPRPNVKREVDIYTDTEKGLLSVKPGITDLSSIVFSDLSAILANSEDANISYNQLVRPWKSRLGLLYIENRGFYIDILIIIATAVAIVCRKCALRIIVYILHKMDADNILIAVCKRKQPLLPVAPPGSNTIVTSRD